MLVKAVRHEIKQVPSQTNTGAHSGVHATNILKTQSIILYCPVLK